MFRKLQKDYLTKTANSFLSHQSNKTLAARKACIARLTSNISKFAISTISSRDSYVINNRFLDDFRLDGKTEVFMINLNRPFSLKVLESLHKICSYTIMADGAANRFHDRIEGLTPASQDALIPNALIGDFDSVRSDVLEYYRTKGVYVFHDHSQDNTDLEKCLKHLEAKFQEKGVFTSSDKCYRVIITGGFGGRVDHNLNNIHVLHKYTQRYTKHQNISLTLIDNNSLGTCLLPGRTQYIRAQKFEKAAGCGLFPLLGQSAKVRTKGLKWDLDSPNLNFRDFVSSSNEMVNDVIEIQTDEMLFWVTTNTIHGEDSGN